MPNISQLDGWNHESSSSSYCERYYDVLSKNKWTDMFPIKYLSNPNEILEIGGGSQYLSRFLENLFPNASITCTDFAKNRIEDFNLFYSSINQASNIKTVGGINAESLPYDSGKYDLICGDAMLHHVEDIRSCLLEINRCLKPNGIAIFVREPSSGLREYLKLQMLYILSNASNIKNGLLNHLYANRWEYNKTLLQWYLEFNYTGFTVSRKPGWYFLKKRLQSYFPFYHSCLNVFILRKVVDSDLIKKKALL